MQLQKTLALRFVFLRATPNVIYYPTLKDSVSFIGGEQPASHFRKRMALSNKHVKAVSMYQPPQKTRISTIAISS